MTNLEFERHFFEIAVYRCSPDSFHAKRERDTQEHLDWIARNGGPPRDQFPDIYKAAAERFVERYGTWRYNQIVGWVRLYVLGRQVRGEIWFVDAKRIRQDMSKKNFRYYGKAFELSFLPGEDSSAEIYSQVCAALQELCKGRLLRGRYLDLEEFHNVGSFINWRKLIGLEL